MNFVGEIWLDAFKVTRLFDTITKVLLIRPTTGTRESDRYIDNYST